MSTELLERGVAALGNLVDEVVFVGGATIPLWITDPAAPPPRPTKDVDVIIEVATRSAYYFRRNQTTRLGVKLRPPDRSTNGSDLLWIQHANGMQSPGIRDLMPS